MDKAIEDYDLSTTMSAMVLFAIGLCEQIDDDHPAEQPALAHRTMTTLAAAREIAKHLSMPARPAQPMMA